ncbi:hypothetical protein [Aliarcobacter butzleri]|uniref:hypothetical protein n=1 Tax=Aliarcobacter butzleri TaxID=28197 RepID=UPI0021B21B94|nr:hypothetical protein [Aliarcobacter butzleri]MCT7596569.1 hypothetical protein [Aliarcobacter butzleri]MDN5095179.1 hypothetical protein [Aliarcobacter butzleri]
MNTKNILEKKKEFLLNNYLDEDELKNLKPTKLLFLIQDEIEALLKFYTKKEIHLMINSIFEKNISLSLLYLFCSENITKDSNSSDVKNKINHQVSQNFNTKNIVNNIDDLTSTTLDFISKNLPKK